LSSLSRARLTQVIGRGSGGPVTIDAAFQQFLEELVDAVEEGNMPAKTIYFQGQPTTTASVVATGKRNGGEIFALTAHNASGSSVTLDVWIDVTGSYGAVDRTKVASVSIAAGAVEDIAEARHAFPKGAKLHLKADALAALTVTVTGRN
jgi:hypothetical protein